MRNWLYPLLLLPGLLNATNSPPIFSTGVGLYNVTGIHKRVFVQLEYKFSPFYWHFRPQVGGMITEQKTTYFYGGIACDLYLVDKIVLTPSFSPGLYIQAGGKNLGFPLEFRSGLSFAVERDYFRLGAEFFHLSHGHIVKRNPGVNSLVFYLSIPFSK
ncbi:MAG: acyloxyacyl hydrolase [Chlamydiota bacterium]